MIQSLFPSVQAGELLQERGMYVDNATFEGAKKLSFQHPHKTGQDHQIYPGRPERFHVGSLSLVIQLGPKLPWRDKLGQDVSLASARQNSGLGHITQNDGDVRRHRPRRASIGDSDKIGTLSGTKYPDTESRLRHLAGFLMGGCNLHKHKGTFITSARTP